MSIACDSPGCEVRCNQPLPLGWDMKWIVGVKHYEHFCPDHSGVKMPDKNDPVTKNLKRPRKKTDPDDGQSNLF